MFKKLVFAFALALTSCISIAVETESPTLQAFVTSTLPPTQAVTPRPGETVTPEVSVTPTISVTRPADCTDSAVLSEDVTIPDGTRMDPSQKFTKTWRFINNGTCPWVNYTLVFAAGDQMGAPLSAPIPLTDAKAKVDISVELTAPAVDGSYTAYFTLHNSDDKIVPIGTEQTFWVKITVGSGPTVAPTTSSSIPTQSGGGSLVASVGGNCNYSQNAGYVNQLAAMINEERASAGKPALSINAALMDAAQSHAADMACNNLLGHIGSDGSHIGERLLRAGFSAGNGFAEIIAIGTPQDAMNQWRSDPGHWEILFWNNTQIGIGYAYSANSNYGGYFTVDFGSP